MGALSGESLSDIPIIVVAQHDRCLGCGARGGAGWISEQNFSDRRVPKLNAQNLCFFVPFPASGRKFRQEQLLVFALFALLKTQPENVTHRSTGGSSNFTEWSAELTTSTFLGSTIQTGLP